MKFGKSLSAQIEERLLEWRDKFLSYKELKKRLKLLIILEIELEKFNGFFIEKEEEYIIRKETKEELMKVRKEIVDLHGRMKYDKRTKALIRLSSIQKVLQQPFFTTDLIYKHVKESETMLQQLFPKNEPCVSGDVDGVPELEEIEIMESMYMKSTVATLRVLKEIRRGSSTVSVFTLPSLQSSGLEKRWDNNIPMLE
ncbi:C-terminal domain of alpha and beta subunits of F1 ATP synthase protein [Dioscorea alata]|uniref:C-terminal domain of alpha and beta subunits of F1 ATP synthase protein n=1 Tax=Dioscorea alata TaxID=55571 RepID=A0ACB7VIR7_DIOAL|nr:C-terminal domain of alpha and beta subunits of F1 ATP synthase protein [Dioscorea alata]